jgi:hypothetical protein
MAVIGGGLLVKAGEGLLLVKDADLEEAEDRGLCGILDLLAAGLPAVFG